MSRLATAATGDKSGKRGQDDLWTWNGGENWQDFCNGCFQHLVITQSYFAQEVKARTNLDRQCQPTINLDKSILGAGQQVKDKRGDFKAAYLF